MNEEAFKKIVEDALEAKLGGFFIERERHFKDHEFITDVRNMKNKIEGHACKVVTGGGMAGLGLLLLWGVYRFLESIGRVKS